MKYWGGHNGGQETEEKISKEGWSTQPVRAKRKKLRECAARGSGGGGVHLYLMENSCEEESGKEAGPENGKLRENYRTG